MLFCGHCSDEGDDMRTKLLSRMVAPVSGLLLFGAFASTTAVAAYVVTFEEVGPNVEAVGGGSLNLAALQLDDMTSDSAFVFAQGAAELTGSTTLTPIDVYIGISGPPSLGPGGSSFGATNGSRDLVGMTGSQDLTVPRGYVSGALLSDKSVYADQSFMSLGLTPNVYVYTWGSGATADSLTIVVGDVPELSTWALTLLGFAGLGYVGHRASRRGAAATA
jgi:hypothetical protein